MVVKWFGVKGRSRFQREYGASSWTGQNAPSPLAPTPLPSPLIEDKAPFKPRQQNTSECASNLQLLVLASLVGWK